MYVNESPSQSKSGQPPASVQLPTLEFRNLTPVGVWDSKPIRRDLAATSVTKGPGALEAHSVNLSKSRLQQAFPRTLRIAQPPCSTVLILACHHHTDQ